MSIEELNDFNSLTKWCRGDNNENKLARKLYRQSRKIPYSFKEAICYDAQEDEISFSGCLSSNERFEPYDSSKVIGYLGSHQTPSSCWQYAMNILHSHIIEERRILKTMGEI